MTSELLIHCGLCTNYELQVMNPSLNACSPAIISHKVGQHWRLEKKRERNPSRIFVENMKESAWKTWT